MIIENKRKIQINHNIFIKIMIILFISEIF
jgi:hypothetical protein